MKKRPKITDCSTYNAQHAGMRHFFDSSNEWKRINGVYREVRNDFAHNQGQLTDKEFELTFIELEELNAEVPQPFKDIHLEKNFCFTLIDDALIFFELLFDSMLKSFSQHKR